MSWFMANMYATKRFEMLSKELNDAYHLLENNKAFSKLTSDWERNLLSDAAFLCERIANKFREQGL